MSQKPRCYYRPVARSGPDRPASALPLAGAWAWFAEVERIERTGQATRRRIIAATELPDDVAHALTAPRAPVAGLDPARPAIMGILNVTPDSFSDGGRWQAPDDAVERARAMLGDGADILDIGGESTRPGAAAVPEAEEAARTVPVIARLCEAGAVAPISIDTRKAGVAAQALAAGASMLNDVSALTYDAAMAGVAAASDAALCLMHAQGTPQTMQRDPRYDDVLLDVYDFLAERIAAAEAAGIGRARLIVDPGIGFGKTQAHNLALIRGLSLFHALGCVVLLGASRKRFIGTIGREPEAARRAPGSVAVALEGVRQGVQIVRVHDIGETRQALSLWQAVNGIGKDRSDG